MDTVEYFKVTLFVMGFYAIAVTLVSYSIPAEHLNYVTSFKDLGDTIDLKTMSDDVSGSLQRQTNIPVIELGSLVFYSGNILIDLLLNFVSAIPQMITLLLNGTAMLINLNAEMMGAVQMFISAIMVIFYIVGLVQLLTNVRSGRAV